MTDKKSCKADIEHFKKLGINTIRVYTVDNSADHDNCMNALADEGIYVAIDVNNPKYSLNREDYYGMHASYNDVYLQNVFATVEAFAKYDNTLLFFAANEVMDSMMNSWAASYVKAVVRDVKEYLVKRDHRAIPVGYAAANFALEETSAYMNCGGDAARSDFFAFKDFNYCSRAWETDGWEAKAAGFNNYSIPLL